MNILNFSFRNLLVLYLWLSILNTRYGEEKSLQKERVLIFIQEACCISFYFGSIFRLFRIRKKDFWIKKMNIFIWNYLREKDVRFAWMMNEKMVLTKSIAHEYVKRYASYNYWLECLFIIQFNIISLFVFFWKWFPSEKFMFE